MLVPGVVSEAPVTARCTSVKPTFQLASPETGTTYWIFVHSPDPIREPGPWPVMFFMDGDNQFAAGEKAYRRARDGGTIPPLLLVGVGYGAGYGQSTNRRGRDYTPTPHTDEPISGGADAFMNFLATTLWSDLARRYPVNDGARGIAGHSLGSLLVLYALFQPRPFFTHHLASAPSIWWADRAILGHVQRLRARQSSLPAKLYLGVGANDSGSMRGDLALLEAQLAAHPFAGLAVTSEQFPQRDHYDAIDATFPAGLTALFGPPSLR